MPPFATLSASQPPAFKEAFERLQGIVTFSDAREFHSTTLKDVFAAAQEIERKLAARKSMCNMRRIQPLLDGLQLFSGPVEVLCNGTPYLPWIWAPIKLMLQLASQYAEIMEKLLDAYGQIAAVMPRFDRITEHFAENPSICYMLSVVYADILEFHRRAYKFVRRRGWKNFFHSSWGSFDIRFKTILSSLDKHSDWLDRETNSISIVEAKEWRRKEQEDTMKREQDRSEGQFRDALAWLAIDDQEEELDRLTSRCQPGTCEWLFENSKIISWCGDGPEELLLWLKGIPGSGKSVLCSQLIQKLKGADECTVVFYICNSYASDQTRCIQILKSIAAQLLRSHKDLSSYVMGEFASRGLTPSVPKLRQLLANMPLRSTRIIIDGLDEVDDKEHRSIIIELGRLTRAKEPSCKVLVSSREGGDISKLLREKAILSLNDLQDEIRGAIDIFVTHQMQEFKDRFKGNILDKIAQVLIEKAGGMFLWVRLVLSTFEDVHNFQELCAAVENLPKGLDEAYGRIIDRIRKNPSESNRDKIIRMLEWIAFSHRPLKTHELLDGMTLHRGNYILDDTSRLGSWVLELGKPIIEEGPGKTLDFVHFSAKEFLIDKLSGPFLQAAQAHHNIALSCVLYLSESFKLFHPSITDKDMKVRIVKGFHSLHLYAHRFWLQHLKEYAQAVFCKDIGKTGVLFDQLQRLLEARKEEEAARTETLNLSMHDPQEARSFLQAMENAGEIYLLIRDIVAFHRLVSENHENQNNLEEQRAYEAKYDPTWFSQILHRYQDTMEELMTVDAEMPSGLDPESVIQFKSVHGTCPFVCRYPKCIRAFDGFSSSYQRDQHETVLHYRRWKCDNPNCPSFVTGFNSARALVQHNQSHHWTPAAFPGFNDGIEGPNPPGPSDDWATNKKTSNPRDQSFICSGTLPSKKKWGCGEGFSTAAALKAHFRTTVGFNCIQELYSETATPIAQEDLQPPQQKFFFSSNCHGTLNSGIEWGCKRNFASEWSLLQHWQSSIGRRCRQALHDEVDAKLKKWEDRKSAAHLPLMSGAHTKQPPTLRTDMDYNSRELDQDGDRDLGSPPCSPYFCLGSPTRDDLEPASPSEVTPEETKVRSSDQIDQLSTLRAGMDYNVSEIDQNGEQDPRSPPHSPFFPQAGYFPLASLFPDDSELAGTSKVVSEETRLGYMIGPDHSPLGPDLTEDHGVLPQLGKNSPSAGMRKHLRAAHWDTVLPPTRTQAFTK